MKGLIMEHAAGGVYILTQSGEFRFLNGHTHLPVGGEVTLRPAPRLNLRRAIAAVACAAMVLVGAATVMWNTERFAVYVDINPSFQVSFNMFNRVRAVEPLNPDGADFLRGIRVKGGYAKALDTVMTAAESHAEGGTPYIQLTVTANREANQARCYDQICSYASSARSGVVVASCTTQERAAAEGRGVSPGKLQMAEAALAYLPEDDLDSVIQMSTAELHLSIEEGALSGRHVEAAQQDLDAAATAAQRAETAAKRAQTAAQSATVLETSAPEDTNARQTQISALVQAALTASGEALAAALEADGAAQAAQTEAVQVAQGESRAAQAAAQTAEVLALEAQKEAQRAAQAAQMAAQAAAETQAALQREDERLANENAGSNNGSPAGENSSDKVNENAGSNNGSPPGENSSGKVNENANENAGSNNGSPPGENSSGKVNENANENASSNNGSPPGENSSGKKNENANENASTNNGSPPGENSSGKIKD